MTKEELVEHILWLKTKDVEYAREAFKFYDRLLPWMNLKEALRERLNDSPTALARSKAHAESQER